VSRSLPAQLPLLYSAVDRVSHRPDRSAHERCDVAARSVVVGEEEADRSKHSAQPIMGAGCSSVHHYYRFPAPTKLLRWRICGVWQLPGARPLWGLRCWRRFNRKRGTFRNVCVAV